MLGTPKFTNRSIRCGVGVILAVALSAGAACAPSAVPNGGSPTTVPGTPSGPVVPDRVRLPGIPLPQAQSFVVSDALMELLGCAECDRSAAAGTAADAAKYFYGQLPLATVDAQLAGTAGDLRASLGNLHASGYFGGIYLRGSLAGAGDTGDLTPFAPLLDLIGAGSLMGIDSVVTELVRVSRTGTDQEVRDASTLWSAILAGISGYNRGYLEVLLEQPPAGVTAPNTFSCPSLFDCRSTELPLQALTALEPQRNQLNTPTSFDWLAVSLAANNIGTSAVDAGRGVWDGVLSTADVAPAVYPTLVDLSVGFLEVTQAAMLANLAGATGTDLALARRGLVATASMVTWAGSYFLGLASPLPNSAQPQLLCG